VTKSITHNGPSAPKGSSSNDDSMKILVTGGAGYVGSITAAALEEYGHTPIILDSLLSGPHIFTQHRVFYEGDIADRHLIRKIVTEHPDIECTIHMAARVVVPESVAFPYEYYRDNVAKSLELFDELVRLQKPRVVFSSSASVYAPAKDFEVFEDSPLNPLSPYARTKQVMEMILADLAASTHLRAIILRYFNPIGSDPYLRSGVHVRAPSHVLGQIVMAARGQREAFMVTGIDYPTRDCTGLRDYIYVWDLAVAHVHAVERFDEVLEQTGERSTIINLGTGKGVTVRELISTVERVLGRQVPVREAPRRVGDAVGGFANVDKARTLLKWSTQHSLEDGVRSALDWAAKRSEILGYD
jgi:UDP-glucose 4-epimerase